ncbi:MAG: EamA family transporter [SAR202 cluster bacterium]|nr:MAG: EamA family transporter [SAR202 cluster bacterium]|tara:strand:- start:7030 stop:7428 length:399 start_codon:yes stop_codon:yes gene_type:complete
MAALGFGLSAVFIKAAMSSVSVKTATVVSLISSTVVTMIFALIFHSKEILALSPMAFLWFILAGLITFLGGRLLNFQAINLVGASKASAVVSATPLFAAILAVTFLNETVNLMLGIGTMMIVTGIALVVMQE